MQARPIRHATLLVVGSLASDFNTGAFTARLDPARMITVNHHSASVDGNTYPNVEIGDLLSALACVLPKREWPRIELPSAAPATGSGDDPITAEALYPPFPGVDRLAAPREPNFTRANFGCG